MDFTSNAPGKNKSGFSSWFGPGHDEEEEDIGQASHLPYLWDNEQNLKEKTGPRGSFDRRKAYASEARPKSAIAIAQANKPRVRTTPLKRTVSGCSERSGASPPDQLIRMTSNNETAIMIAPGKKRESKEKNEEYCDAHSAQSSITNSWAPRLKLVHPAPYVPHKPIENMVISIQKPGSESDSREEAGKGGDDNTNSTARSSSHSGLPGGSLRRNTVELLGGVQEADELDTQDQQSPNACMLSLALTEEQKAEVEQFVFRGWGSDDEMDAIPQPKKFAPPVRPKETNNSKQTTGRFAVEEEVLPHSTPQTIQDAIKELQALTGIQVKCLDEDEGFKKGDAPGASRVFDEKTEIISGGHVDEVRKEKQNDDHKAGWFFGAPTRKEDPHDIQDDLGQPYALIRSDHDEARFRKHCEEEERLRQQEDRRIEEEKRKKKASWFFFSKDSESVEVLDDDKIADALDDLEILAGEVRVSQVKEARLLERDEREQEGRKEKLVGKVPIDGIKRSVRSSAFLQDVISDSGQGVLSDSSEVRLSSDFASRGILMPDWHMKSLSRFALPLETVDNHNRPGWKEIYERHNGSLTIPAAASTRQVLSNSLSLIGKAHLMDVDIDENQNPQEESPCKDREFEDIEIDESLPRPPRASELKKEALIEDLSKRNLRWRLNQASVDSVFKQYHNPMASIDSLLPSHDEFDNMKHIGESIGAQFHEVRNKMLEDGNLSEREVASFFAGFSLLAMKARSLQSQLDAVNAIHRATAEERKLQNLSPDTLMSEDITKEAPRILLIKSMISDLEVTSDTKALLRQLEVNERKRIKLEKELLQSGNPLPEQIPFQEAKGASERISKRIDELRSKNTRWLTETKLQEHNSAIDALEKEMQQYQPSVIMGGTWVKVEEKWEAENAAENLDALRRIRRHMPVNVEFLNEDQMAIETTPNGKLLPRRIAKKFKQTTVLQLLRSHPDDIFLMHPSTLENLQRANLTLSERRALYLHLKGVAMRWRAAAEDPAASRKWAWSRMLKQEFKEALLAFKRHCEEFGPPDSHVFATRANPTMGCPLIGKQCPVKADKMFDYGVDYGFPDGNVFAEKGSTSDRTQGIAIDVLADSDDAPRKKSLQRREPIEKHYAGRVLQIALASESCEAMDKIMDRMEFQQEAWIEDRLRREKARFTDMQRRIEIGSFAAAVHELKLALPPLAERARMQLTGNKESNAARPDGRSPIELGLCEEVWEHAEDFFIGIESRLKELDANDTEVKAEIIQLRELIDELHNRNMCTINELGVRYPEASRKLVKRKEIEQRVRDKLANEVVEVVPASEMPSLYKMMGRPTTARTATKSNQPEHKGITDLSNERRGVACDEHNVEGCSNANIAPSNQRQAKVPASVNRGGMGDSSLDHSPDDIDSNAILPITKSRRTSTLVEVKDDACECDDESVTDVPSSSGNPGENVGAANSSFDDSKMTSGAVAHVHGDNFVTTFDINRASGKSTVLTNEDVESREKDSFGQCCEEAELIPLGRQHLTFAGRGMSTSRTRAPSASPAATPGVSVYTGMILGEVTDAARSDEPITSSTSDVRGATCSQGESHDIKIRMALSAAEEVLPSPTRSTNDVSNAAKPPGCVMASTAVRLEHDEAPLESSNSEVAKALIDSGDDQLSHGRTSADAGRPRRSQIRASPPHPVHATSGENTKLQPAYASTELVKDFEPIEKQSDTTAIDDAAIITNFPQREESDLVTETLVDVSVVPTLRGDTGLSVKDATANSESRSIEMLSDHTEPGKVAARAHDSADPSAVSSLGRSSLPLRERIADEWASSTAEKASANIDILPVEMLTEHIGGGKVSAAANQSAGPNVVPSSGRNSVASRERIADESASSTASDLSRRRSHPSSQRATSFANDSEELHHPPRDESTHRSSRSIRERLSAIMNDADKSGKPILSNSSHGRSRHRIRTRMNDVERQADTNPVHTNRRESLSWRERIAARTNDVDDSTNPTPVDTPYRKSLSWRERVAAITNDFEESAALTPAGSCRRGSLPLHDRIASTTNGVEHLTDPTLLDSSRCGNVVPRKQIAARTSDVSEFADSTKADATSSDQLPSLDTISVKSNYMEDATDPTLALPSQSRPIDVGEKVEELKSDVEEVADRSRALLSFRNGDSLRDFNASAMKTVDPKRRKSLLLREKIAEVKRNLDECTDPFPSDSTRGKSLSSIGIDTSRRTGVVESADPDAVASSRPRSRSLRGAAAPLRENLDKDSTDAVPWHSTRRKSVVLRERFGRSPGRDRDATGVGVESSESRPSLESRRAQVQAGIAERKKAREAAARALEMK